MRLLSFALISFILCSFAPVAYTYEAAGEDNESLQALFQAYGGKEALTNIRTFEGWNEQFHTGSGQGYKPGPSLEGYDRHIYTIDFAAGNAGHEVWSLYTGSYFHLNTVTTPETGYEVDYRREIIKTSPPQDMQFVLQRARRENPLLLVRELVLNPDSVISISRPDENGFLALEFTLGRTAGTLLINPETFLVESAEFGSRDQKETYDYYDYEALGNGMLFPARVEIQTPFIEDGKAKNLNVQVNAPVENLLAFEEQLKESGSLDQSQMTIRELGDGVFHVGRFGNYSLFVDQGTHLVAIGGGPGIAERLAFIQEQVGPKPLNFLVATHHHSDHINFLAELARTETRFVTVDSNFPLFVEVFPGTLEPERLVAVEGTLTLETPTAPAVQIFETNSPHAYRQLMAYVPAAKTVFVADMFEETSPYPSLQPATRNVLSIRDTIEELDLEVDVIATPHSPRLLTMQELYQAASRPVPEYMCFEGRTICSDPAWSDVKPF